METETLTSTEPIAVATPTETISVAVVDDDARIRQNLVAILDLAENVRCVGAFASGEEAVAALPALRPQVILMDVSMPGMNGVDCVRAIARTLPKTQIIMLTVRQDTELIFAALASGASGYLLKPVRAADLLHAIRDVFAGGAPMSSFIAREVVQYFKQASPPPPMAEKLTARELEVLELLARGFAYKEISDQLGIAYATVNIHIARTYKKLHVQSRGEAVAKYLHKT